MPESLATLHLGFAGDVMIGRLVDEHLEHAPPNWIWGNMLPLIHQMDMRLINLETALTYSEEIVPKVFNFKADPSKVCALKEAAIDVVNLANNHILDYSISGLLETLKTLRHAEIPYVGAGRTLDEAARPVILTKQGIRIGILGFTDNEPQWAAEKGRPGIRYLRIGDAKTILKDLEELRPHVDLLIASAHWGPNMRERPSKEFIQFAHFLIDHGVDILHGHSAHIFQGVEVYRNKLILYDTGDFIDDYYVDPDLRNDRTFFFIVDVNQKGLVQLKLVPALISNFQVNHAKGKEREGIIRRMIMLSQEMGTDLKEVEGMLVYDFN